MTAYGSQLQFAELSGLGLRIVDENVGTGDDSETNFDLDNDNLVEGGYTLSYAASGSNDMTALVETTDYSLDEESGRIILTTAGKTALSTNILYATYWYLDTFNDSQVSAFLNTAKDEIDILTGMNWSSGNSKTQYFDVNKVKPYPTTDRPYMNDYDRPDFLNLDFTPVTQVNYVFLLNDPQGIGYCYNYDLGTTTYTDITENVNEITEAPITLFNATPAAGDYLYIGSTYPFVGITTNLSTVGTGSPAITFEYYNGSSWTAISVTEGTTGSSTFEASGSVTWTYPFGWEKNSVNSQSFYWMRAVVGTGYSTAPIAASIVLNDSINTILNPQNVVVKESGQLNFMSTRLPYGINKARVDYVYGYATTPDYIDELNVLMASEKAYLFLTGSSYDAATGYQLGTKHIQIGEQYVNIREVLVQFRNRMNQILDMVGRRSVVRGI